MKLTCLMSINSSLVKYQNFILLLLIIGVTLDGTSSFQDISVHKFNLNSPRQQSSYSVRNSAFLLSRERQRCQSTSRFGFDTKNNHTQSSYSVRNSAFLLSRERQRCQSTSRFGFDTKNNHTPENIISLSLTKTTAVASSRADDEPSSVNSGGHRRLEKKLSIFNLLTPIWILLVSFVSISNATSCSNTFGSLYVMQMAYRSLMFAMGLTITPKDLTRAISYPFVLSINALLCFGVMPLLAGSIAKGLSSSSQTIGLILLGSVGGGQASNLFTLIAGGDVALSIICTISTTLLGVIATPLLVHQLLGYTVDVNGYGVIKTIAWLILLPILSGSFISIIFPKAIKKISPFLPALGIFSTLVLVAGGSSNTFVTASTLAVRGSSLGLSLLVPSCLLSVLGATIAWCVTSALKMDEQTKKTLVVETLSKSPTLAYVLAMKHFDLSAASIPAAAMVKLAVIGALVASIWATISSTTTITMITTTTTTK
jgi:BASS family bile acid:Na+ symporter